jgi:hypothetical protein
LGYIIEKRRATMLKHTHIRETELAKLRLLRNELAAKANYEKHQRLRQQAEAETVNDYWHEYQRRNQVAQRRGTAAR